MIASHSFERITNAGCGIHSAMSRELKQATFLSQERKPEVNILRARTVISPKCTN